MLNDKQLSDLQDRCRKRYVIRYDEIEMLISMAMTLNTRNSEPSNAKPADPNRYLSGAPTRAATNTPAAPPPGPYPPPPGPDPGPFGP